MYELLSWKDVLQLDESAYCQGCSDTTIFEELTQPYGAFLGDLVVGSSAVVDFKKQKNFLNTKIPWRKDRALGNGHTLDLSRCYNVTDVSALDNIHTLTLSGCEQSSSAFLKT